MREGTFPPKAALIRKLRKQKGLTQEELASRMGCAKKTVENLEAGKPAIMRTFREAATALEYPSARYFIDRSDSDETLQLFELLHAETTEQVRNTLAMQ